ncbi:MAG TPA: DNA polymerase/3'-5' exonuclease PolX [Planctomycetaceae bacterium]|nr:DNA polymerase/3'-5' exonuclease PolX [Planctomycetaceae bacterium]
MNNQRIAAAFDELADLLEIQDANPFRVRAYRNASRTLESLTESVSEIVASDSEQLTDLPGIGKDLAAKIEQLVTTGSIKQLEELRKEVPRGLIDITHIEGIGPKKAGVLFRELNITGLDDLKQAAQQGQVQKLKGFGKKTEESILANIDRAAEAGKRTMLAEAEPAVEAIVETLSALDSVQQISPAGSFRRRKESVGDLDLLVTSDDQNKVMDALASHELVEQELSRGETKQRVRLQGGLELDLRVVPEASYGAALLYFTGSKEHNIVLRRRAQDRDLKLNEYGLFRGDESVAGTTEEEVYKTLDLAWIPPELRENREEFELAESNNLPDLIELDDIAGDLHMHTTATDGTASIEDMIAAAKQRGRKYIAITDHSKRVSMANGLDADRLREHWKNIRSIAEKTKGIHVLCGIECDILEDATLDLPDDVLAEADWVLAVLHYGLKQDKQQIHKRLMTAIENPYVSAIGHPTGRLIGKRLGAEMDMQEILKAAADHNVMMEINAHPSRLDLNDVHAAAAKELGIPIVINTDAHSTGGLDVMKYGVYQARRAGLTKDDVANAWSWAKFKKLLRT